MDRFLYSYIDLETGDRYFLTTTDLSATDGTSNYERVQFTVQSPPRSGYFAFIENVDRQVNSFTQDRDDNFDNYIFFFNIKNTHPIISWKDGPDGTTNCICKFW